MFVVPCDNCPLRVMPLFVPFSADELAFMRRFKPAEQRGDRDVMILQEGFKSLTLYTVLSVIGTQFVLLEDGRRQVINFVFPGDFIGLQ